MTRYAPNNPRSHDDELYRLCMLDVYGQLTPEDEARGNEIIRQRAEQIKREKLEASGKWQEREVDGE